MSATDTRDKLPKKPWKPEVTPPRGEEDLIEVGADADLVVRAEMTKEGIVLVMDKIHRIMNKDSKIMDLEAEDNTERVIEANLEVEVEDEQGLIKVQMLDVLE